VASAMTLRKLEYLQFEEGLEKRPSVQL